MERKSFREDKLFRYAGVSVGLAWLTLGAVIYAEPYLHVTGIAILILAELYTLARLLFYVWSGVLLWRYWGGYYRREEKVGNRAESTGLLHRPVLQIAIWVGIALVFVLAFNLVPDLVHDKRLASFLLSIGPLALLVAVWIFFIVLMRREKSGQPHNE